MATLPALAGDAPAIDSDWILAKLSHAGPSRTAFVEVRSSPLLKDALRVSGEYRHPDAGTLVREVRSPYQETTTIHDGKASIQRGGSTRTFSLSRAHTVTVWPPAPDPAAEVEAQPVASRAVTDSSAHAAVMLRFMAAFSLEEVDAGGRG